MRTLIWLKGSLSAGASRPVLFTYLVMISRLFSDSQDAMHKVTAVKQDTLNRQQLSMPPAVNILIFPHPTPANLYSTASVSHAVPQAGLL